VSSFSTAFRVVLALLTTGCLLSACDGEPARHDEPPNPRVTPDPFAETPQSEALGKVDLVGPPDSRITWRLPSTLTPGGPVDVARHLEAIWLLRQAPGNTADSGQVSAFVVTGEDLDFFQVYVRKEDARGDTTGPRRVWLARTPHRRTEPGIVQVRVCEDHRGITYEHPPERPNRRLPWDTKYWNLERVEDFDGARVWKVTNAHSNPFDKPLQARLDSACDQWATR
jgi:hypothetical protein